MDSLSSPVASIRMTSEPLLVDCKQFGERQLDCKKFGESKLDCASSASMTNEMRHLRNLIAANWDAYWSHLYEATSEMAKQVLGTYDFDASFERNNFRIHIEHYDCSDGADLIMFRVEFLDSHSRVIYPVFDTTFEGLEIVHNQPCY
jgi:hypothetical protein